MSDRELGAVVVGTGFGVATHLRALRGAGIPVRALVGRSPERTAERASLFDVPVGTTDLEEALALPGVDIVAVATPPATHLPIVLAAVAAGKHVLCEKPFALDVGEARQIRDAAAAAGVVALVGTEFRFGTIEGVLRRAVAAGEVGEPKLAMFVVQVPSLPATGEWPSWWETAAEGGGWLGAHGPHLIDQVRVTLGEFEEVSAIVETLGGRRMTADDTFLIQFRLRGGCVGTIAGSCITGGMPILATKVTGTTGSAWVQGSAWEPGGSHVMVEDGGAGRALPVPDDLVHPPAVPAPQEILDSPYSLWHSGGMDLAPFTRLFQAMAARIRGEPVPDDPPVATFDDGVAIQAVMDAVRQSSRERRWVRLDEI